MRRPSQVLTVAFLVSMLVVALAAGAALAQDTYVDVVINGQLLAGGGLIYGDRTYVDLRDVARVLGGRFVYDAQLNVAFIQTGRYEALVRSALTRLNPEIAGYREVVPFRPGIGADHRGAGPELGFAVTPAGVVTALVSVHRAAVTEPMPWFDQGGGAPEEYPGVGPAFTQHLYVISRSLIHAGSSVQIAFNGAPLAVRGDAVMWHGGRLWARLRDLAGASGGGVGWDQARRVASAKIVPGRELTFDRLALLNSYLTRHYEPMSDVAPGGGELFGPSGPGIVVGVDSEGLVDYFELWPPLSPRIDLTSRDRSGS